MSDPDKPYFAPPAEGATPAGEVPTWGEDAQEIAREAGLGSYGADPIEQDQRQEPLIQSLERADADMVRMRLTIRILGLAVFVLIAALIWALTSQ